MASPITKWFESIKGKSSHLYHGHKSTIDKATEMAASTTSALGGTTEALNRLVAQSEAQGRLLEGFIAGSKRRGA